MERKNRWGEKVKMKRRIDVKKRSLSCVLAMALLMTTAAFGAGCQSDGAAGSGSAGKEAGANGAEKATADANNAWYDKLDFDDKSELENAKKGLIKEVDDLVIRNADGDEIWNAADYKFLRESEKAPDTVNPSLWNNTLYNSYAGLFQVCDGIYQVRGYDMSNLTFIKSDHGWIVFDTLMCKENAEAALELMKENVDKDLNITAIIYSHSHIDHYGGVGGLISAEDAADANASLEDQIKSGKVPVIAPEGFLEHAVSENLYAGKAMTRRAQYQYGSFLETGETGRMSIGIGLGQSLGLVTLISPTYEVKSDEKLNIDGVNIEFQLTPGTEAPAEMNAYFSDYKALWLAENCTGTMHNLYTLRGAQVRDPESWCNYILAARQKFGDKTEVTFQSHNWPHWGTDIVNEYMENTASVYKFINDQTLHYINQGLTSTEIAKTLKLPDKLEKVWYTRQYYGTLSHNIKAVYQKYMGWYDANPVNLDLLTPEETAKKYVEYMGDTKEVLKKARADYEKGEYQWVAQITKELVYADPTNKEARLLCADALEQLGYQAESGTWRNAYLSAAVELREGNQAANAVAGSSGNMISEMTPDMLFEYVAIMSDSDKAQNDDVKINFVIDGSKYYVERKNGVILVYPGDSRSGADADVECAKAQLLALLNGENTLTVKGDATAVQRLFKYFEPADGLFNIIEP